jgi:class 3 adenylate cyclase
MAARAQTVTILFTDLVSSTELLQRAGDERAQRIFKTHHRLLSEAVQAHGGHEVKWLGDGLMVAFESARDAAQCAIAMQQASRRPAAGERLQIRVGLHVGEALRDESDYFGTPVVIARRLCDTCTAGQIIASDLVVRLLDSRQEITFEDLGQLALKGIETPVAAHAVRYEHDPLAMLAVTPFVGRDDVIATLARKLDEARAGKGALVMLVGEPGIGKTRTAEEFGAQARHSGALVLSGRCYDGEWAAPFSPFMEAIRAYAADAPVEELTERLGADAGVLARIVPALRERLPDIAEPPAIPAEGERYRLLEAAGDFFARMAVVRPLVLMLDDLHWADKGTIAMLRQVSRLAPQQRLLLVGAYRDVELDRTHPLSEALQALRRETNYERIVLKGLDAADVGELLSLVAEQSVPETFARAIGEETGGNPFFIREVMLHLVEEQRIVQEDGRWVAATAIAEMRIPEGVREVIGRRLSRVSEACGRMLSVASALTAGFSWEVMSALVDLGDAALLDAIDEALAAQLIAEGERGRYEFTHALIRHTLYEELSTPRRVLLHRQIGESLERLYAAEIEAHLAELAHHFYQDASTQPERALDYAVRAGDRALALLSFDEAAALYRRAVEILGPSDPARRAELFLAIGRAEFGAGSFVRSREGFRQAGEAARIAGRNDLFARAALQEFRIYGDDDDEFRAFLEEAIERSDGVEDSVLAKLMGSLAWRPSYSGSEEERDSLFERAAVIARRSGDPAALAYVLFWWHWRHRQDPDLAWRAQKRSELAEAAAAAASDASLPRFLVSHHALYDALTVGDIDEVERNTRLFCAFAAETRIPQNIALGEQYWLMLTIFRGDYETAEQLFSTRVSGVQNPTDAQASLSLYLMRRDQGRSAELLPLWSSVQDDPGVLGSWVRL